MRPEVLNPLFAEVTALPGVGPKLAPLYAKLCGSGAVDKSRGARVVDLLWHLPSGLVDRRHTPKAADAVSGQVATMTLTVVAHYPSDSPRRPYRVRMADETATVTLVYFHAREDWLKKLLPEGEVRVVSGTVDRYNDEIQITHPDHVVPPSQAADIQVVEPIHPLTAGLTAQRVAKTVEAALARAPHLPEWQDPAWKHRQGWADWKDALWAAHHPESQTEIVASPHRRRLAYDELLSNQLALMLVRAKMRRAAGRPLGEPGELRTRLLAALPFTLTRAQTRVLAEIDADLGKPERMARLL